MVQPISLITVNLYFYLHHKSIISFHETRLEKDNGKGEFAYGEEQS
jgi:hypothetical protein